MGILDGFVTRYKFMRRRAADEVDSVVDGGVEGLKKDLKEIRDLILMEDAGGGADGDMDGGDPGIIWSDASKKMNKEMVLELKIFRRWVEGHLTSMYRKTDCSNRTELVRWAVAMGYVDMFGG